MNSSFNFSFSQLLKDLLIFKIMKHESTSKLTAQFEAISEYLLFSLFFIILLYIFEKQAWNEANTFFNCFCLSLFSYWLIFPLFMKLKAFNQTQCFTLDFIYMCYKVFSFHFRILCKFYTTWKFKRSFHCILLIVSGDISLNPGPFYDSQWSCSNEWNVFKVNEIYLIHLNINSLFSKIFEIR